MSEAGDLKNIGKFVRGEKQRQHPDNPNAGQPGFIKAGANNHRQTTDLRRVSGPFMDPNVRVIPRGVHRGKRVSTYQNVPGTVARGPIAGHSEYVNRAARYNDSFRDVGRGGPGTRLERLEARLAALGRRWSGRRAE